MGKRRNHSRWGGMKRWSIGVTSRYCWYALTLVCMWAILQPALLSHARDIHSRYANHTRHANHTKSYERSCDEISTVDTFIDMPDGITGKWKTIGSDHDFHVSWNRIEVVDLEQYSPERKRQAVLRAWYEDREEAYWEEVVECLKRVDRKRLANLIRGCKWKRRRQLVSCVEDDGDSDPSTGETAASHDESTSPKDDFGNDKASSSTQSASSSDVSSDEVGHGSHSTSHTTSVQTTSSSATKNGHGNSDHSTNQETTTSTTASAAKDDASGGSDLASGDTSTTVPDTTSGSLNSAHGTTSNEMPEHSAAEWKEISDIVNVLLYMLEAVKQEQQRQPCDCQKQSCSELACYKPPPSSGRALSSTSQELVSGQQTVNNLFLFLRNHKDLHIHVSFDNQQIIVAVQSDIQQPVLVVDECSFVLHCLCLLLLLGGDIERNPGPKTRGGLKRELEGSDADEGESPGAAKKMKFASKGGADKRKRKIDRTDNVKSAGGSLKKPRHTKGICVADAFRNLLPVANDWQNIGTLMGILPDTLENIRTREKEVPINCLRAMLEKAFVLTDPPLTWKAIAEAVEPINPAKAREIRDKYCGVGCQLKTAKHEEPKDGPREPSNRLKPVSSTLPEPTEYYQKFDIDCSKAETSRIRRSFNILFTQLELLLLKHKVNVEVLMIFLHGFSATETGESLFKGEFCQLQRMNNPRDILRVVRGYCSWYNHHLLGNMIEAFSMYLSPDGERIMKAYEEYCEKFRIYCQPPRIQICKVVNGSSYGPGRESDKTHITVKIDDEWGTDKIQQADLEDITSVIGKIFELDRQALYLYFVKCGCVELHYLVPKFVADAIFPLTLVQEAALAESEVICLRTKYYIFSHDEYLQFCKLKESLTEEESTELFSCDGEWTMWAATTLWVHYFSHPMAVRVKEPPSLKYTGSLATARYRKIETKFTRLYLSLQFNRIQNFAQMIDRSNFSVDVKVIALCWSALAEIPLGQFECGEELLRTALEQASKLECENCLLLQGRVLRLMAYMHYIKVFTVPDPSDNTELKKNTDSKDELDSETEAADSTQYFEDEALQIAFEEAMKKGYVKCRMVLLLLIGAAGGGKTHVKNMLFNEPPPPIRQSTPLAEAPIRSTTVSQAISSTTTLEWHKVTLDEVRTMLAEAIRGSEVPLADIEHPLSPPFLGTDSVQTYEMLPQTTTPPPDVSKQDPVSGFDSSIHPRSNQVPGEQPPQTAMDESTDLSQQFEQLELTDLSDDHTSSDVLSKSTAETFTPQKPVLDTAHLTEEFIAQINQSTGSRKLLEVDWVYVIDSGGQPQFSEILPVFVRNASAIIFVVKLNEKLGDRPTVEYYDKEGQKLGSSYTSALTNEKILLHNSQVIRSRQCMSSEPRSPKLFIVGTHDDLKNTCTESVNDKNHRLQDALSSLHDNLACYDSNSLLYPVNAKTPSTKDKWVTDLLRREIMETCKDGLEVPLPWFVYEQLVQQVAQDKGVSLLSTKECKEIAQQLHMGEDAFNAALKYFSDLKLLLYYPQLLPNVVFCNSQVVLDKISELVELSHRLEAMEDVRGEWLQLRDYGIFRMEFLGSLEKHYVEGLFNPRDLLQLLNGLYITFPINNKEYIMPCLLPELSPEEMDNHRQLDPASPATPLLINYPDQVLPAGIFILLVAFLQNTLQWKIILDTSSGKPLCLYRNCAKFSLSTDVEGNVTLMDSFNYLEVHLDAPPGVCQTVCFKICTSIIMGLEKAADTLGYENLKPETGFQVAGDHWINSVHGELTEQQKVWIHPAKESAEELEPQFRNFCKGVRMSYVRMFLEHSHWPPVRKTKFINLALLKSEKPAYGDEYTAYTIRGSADDILARKEEITYTEVFGSPEASARILVEGRPGSGKTTLVNKVSQDWAANNIMKDISLLLLVPLRRFHNKQVIHLTDIVRLFDPEGLNLSVATRVSASGGKGVCIVLDGIDEYSYRNYSNNFITELMVGNLLPNAVVIATSRPAAAQHLRRYASQRVEVLGFLRHQIKRYVTESYSNNKDKVSALLLYLKHHPNIRNMCYLPVHLAMIVYLNDVLEAKHEALPKTETEVYLRFTIYSLLRYLSRDPTYGVVQKLMTPNDLPQELLELFKNICRLAFEMTVELERTISKERVGDVFGDHIEIASLGLVTVDKQFIESGLEETYNFLHLTYQEFLAAYYISGLPDEDQIRLCREHCEHRRMNVVMKFYCGLTKLNGDAPAEVFKTMIGHSNVNLLHLLQCTSESRNSKSCCDLVSSRDGTLALCDEYITPFDCVALAFCINSTSTVLTKIELTACHLDEEEYEVLSSEITGNCAHVKYICLNRTLVRKKAVRCLIRFLHKFPYLQSLEMAKCISKMYLLEEWSLLLKSFTSLTHLSIDVSVAKSFGTHDVFVAIKSLQSLRINGRRLATEITKKAEGSTTVKLLHLKKTSEEVLVTGDSALSKLSVMLQDVLSEPDMAAVVELMKVCSATLRTIQFDFLKGMDAKAAAALCEGLKVCTTLQELNLGENRLGDEGLNILCEGLKLCTSLQILRLQGNNSTDGSINSLADLLRALKYLTHLDVKSNNFTDSGKAALRQAVEERKEMEGFAGVKLLV